MSDSFEEEQKKVLIRLISTTIKDGLKEEEKTDDVISDLDKTSTSLIDLVYSDNEELKNGVLKRFVKDYESVVQQTREELCGSEHDFSEWEKDVVERPRYELDKDDQTCYAPIYIRKCNKCGFRQVAYSKSQRKDLDAFTEYKRNCRIKKLTNKPNTEN